MRYLFALPLCQPARRKNPFLPLLQIPPARNPKLESCGDVWHKEGASGRQALEFGVYNIVWQVLNAIKAHDDRFAAVINQLALAQKDYLKQKDIGQNNRQSPANEIAEALQDHLQFSNTNPELKNHILAKIVHDISEPDYWTKWIDTTKPSSKERKPACKT